MSGFRKILIVLGMRYVSGTRRFTSFGMPSVSGQKCLEFKFLDFNLICEANLHIDIFPQRCSRTLIKR